MKRFILTFIFLGLPLGLLAQAVPVAVTYQGKLLDAVGAPVGNGKAEQKTMVFRLYNSPATGATILYAEQQSVTILNGEFSVLVGKGAQVGSEPYVTKLDAIFGTATASEFYLGVTVDGGTEISPRQQIVTVPLAFRARYADGLSPAAASAIGTTNIATGAVKAAQIDTNAVTTVKILDANVTAAKLAGNAVDSAKIADGTVAAADLGTGAVTTVKILDANVTLAKLAGNAVDSAKIVDGSVALADLATDSVNSNKIVDGSVALVDLGANSVDATKLADNAVTTAKLAASAVTGANIAANTIGLGHLDLATQSVLTKPRQIYNQGLNPTAGTYHSNANSAYTLIPIDLEALGNDADGCKITIIAQHRVSGNFWQFRTAEAHVMLTQPGFVNDPDYPGQIWGKARWSMDGGLDEGGQQGGWYLYWWKFRLGTTNAINQTWGAVGWTHDSWVVLTVHYPGVFRTSAPAPFNVNQENISSNASASGPEVSLSGGDIVSVTGSGSTVTMVFRSPHGLTMESLLIRPPNTNPNTAATTITVASAAPVGTGAPINGVQTLSAVVDPYTLQFASVGAAAASYTGTTVTYKLGYTKFRIWARVHPDVSARIIVSDR